MASYTKTALGWYKSTRWQRLRKIQLSHHPFCQCPHHQEQQVTADTVDHIEPHRGDTRLFWNPNNLQSMSKQCHDKYKQSQEKGGHGFNVGSHIDGSPLNQDHPWYIERGRGKEFNN